MNNELDKITNEAPPTSFDIEKTKKEFPQDKNNKDLDKSFFNFNKKILSSNIYHINEIINLYNLDGDRIINFLIGTLIQSIYDSKK